jgi:hypothetical protein
MISSLRQKIAGFLDRRCPRGRERVRKTGQQHRNSRCSFQARAIASPRSAAYFSGQSSRETAQGRSDVAARIRGTTRLHRNIQLYQLFRPMRGEAQRLVPREAGCPSSISYPDKMIDAGMVAGHDRAMRHVVATVTAIRFALSVRRAVLVELPTRHQQVAVRLLKLRTY